MSPPNSGPKSKPNKKLAESGGKLSRWAFEGIFPIAVLSQLPEIHILPTIRPPDFYPLRFRVPVNTIIVQNISS